MPRFPIGLKLSMLVAFALAIPPANGDETAAVQVHRDLVFAEVDGRALKLDLYLPTVQHAAPLVVWIHGGGWRGGSKNKLSILKITEQGYALASISYRFADTAVFPAQIHDCKAAVRWLRANADRFGYDAESIAVAGSSAGGHLALLMGTSGDVIELEGDVGGNLDQSSRVQAVIDYFGPSDFVLRGRTQPERAYTQKSGSFALLGGVAGQKLDPQTERFASPANYVSDDDPPLLVFHGKADKTVLLDQSQHIVRLYQAAGLVAELVVLESAGHGGKPFFQDERLEQAIRFLDQRIGNCKSHPKAVSVH
ncbi:alpha/beta hydrolase [Roseimaritima ulvae]|uniref:Carboxylesterase NlhH n=1 Tax=Roseimaritima ulvae TaxID=980254 RepID=A0A5B9QGG4_9BACT|nr:alpha/beta hydrolase [Roseimaritima ulvae]QEG38118.1 Carboxylesterase NlhH [Roseimaritima ulvae]